ncbi:tyrosine-type recombinase/integrase [Methylocella sp. CPCC 101449]|uniref:tyrosine-type recombinase/integrase n=1 Tax=Methylocella sp. CPCC 101449 TaxID=2987531 RepID=UPI00288FF1D7|nr:tyrosine-type recombinase/integrase [Methylocella sp. CPCC 101449]MDT2022808.1 site-specific integrase [Methylocella sp. CPCC 101449]
MPKARLSKRVADSAQTAATEYIITDTELPGFGLRVRPSGHKSWIVAYRAPPGGRTAPKRKMVLGVDTAITADEARRRAKQILASVRLGSDPAKARDEARAMPTFGEFAEQFITDVCAPPHSLLKPSTARLYTDNLRRLAIPQLGKLKIDAITRGDVSRMHRKIGASHPTSANNVLVTIAAMYKQAVVEGLVPEGTNPARGVERYKTKAKERFLTTVELARLGEAIRTAETAGLPWALNDLKDPTKAKHRPKQFENTIVVVPRDVTAALRLLIFTGCRKMEILGLRWSEVDFERGILLLAETKTGRRTVVLNAPALAILSEQDRSSEYVFPGEDVTDHRQDITGYWYRIRQHAGLNGADGSEPVRLHDLRHSFASFGVSGGMGLPIVGKLLGHSQAATTSRYAHLDADPVRRASERIGARIAAAMSPELSESENVVRLKN